MAEMTITAIDSAQFDADDIDYNRWQNYGYDRLYIDAVGPKSHDDCYVDLNGDEGHSLWAGASASVDGNTVELSFKTGSGRDKNEHTVVVSLSGDTDTEQSDADAEESDGDDDDETDTERFDDGDELTTADASELQTGDVIGFRPTATGVLHAYEIVGIDTEEDIMGQTHYEFSLEAVAPHLPATNHEYGTRTTMNADRFNRHGVEFVAEVPDQ